MRVIAHRGASGYRPEHTLAAYSLAIDMGCDFIEPDLVLSADGVLVARHENEISGTTDVAQHSEFAARRTRKDIDGSSVDGWFTEDFTLAELKTLRARERIAAIRPANQQFDGQFEIPTFEEILALLRAANTRRARPVGVYPETKHPTYFERAGLAHAAPLLALLERFGYAGRAAPVYIQSFEVANLIALRARTDLPLVQLMEASGAPYDWCANGDARTYADLASVAGLAAVRRYADAIGPNKLSVIGRAADGSLGGASSLVRDAHAAGLAVHAWTFRAENEFLPSELRSSDRAAERGDLAREIACYRAAGVDAIFTDQPDLAVAALR